MHFLKKKTDHVTILGANSLNQSVLSWLDHLGYSRGSYYYKALVRKLENHTEV